MNKLKTLLEKIRNNSINWKSKKTIAVVTVAAAVLFAALTGVTALTVRHINTEPAQTTLPVAEEVTAAAEADELSTTATENAADAANTANTAPTATPTPAQTTSTTNSKTSTSSNNSTGSKTTGKTGSSANSGGASHSTGTNSKPATGSNSSSSNSKPSGGSTAKPTTTKPVTTQPAKKEFAMTKQEIIDYATDYIVNTYHCKYCGEFGKDVPGTGYIPPFRVTKEHSKERIMKNIRGSADATYIQNGWYKVYVEQVDEDTMRVYLFY